LRRAAFLLFLAVFAAIVLRWISLERWAARPEVVPAIEPVPTAPPRSPTPATTSLRKRRSTSGSFESR